MKATPLVFGALALALVAWRWRRLSSEQRVIWAALGVGFLFYGSGVVQLPNLEETIQRIGETLGKWTYLLVGLMAFLETGAFVGLIAPGELTIILGGVVAGQGRISVVVLIGIVWIAAVAGDTTSFYFGRRLGRGFMLRHGPRVKITPARLETVERFFASHGGKTILIGRFVGLVRAIAPFIAGASKMPFRRFLPYDVIGAGTWGTVFVVLGYVFWQSFGQVVRIAKQGAFALGAVITLVVGGIAAYRHFRVPENRAAAKAWLEAQAERPALRPLARVARPLYRRGIAPAWARVSGPLRFLWGRITPGELGLELTSLVAVIAVGSFVFAGLAVLANDATLAGADRDALRLADHLRTSVVSDAAKVVTTLGALYVVGPIVALGALALARRRRVAEALVLAVGLGLTVAGVHIAKAAVDRPRPTNPLVDTVGSSYPSGHAAYAIAFVALAVMATRVGVGAAVRSAAIAVSVAVALIVAFTRIDLRAHFLTDVLGGQGLALTSFALCGAVALVVTFVRNNERVG